MVPVRGEKVIAGAETSESGNARGLLTDVKVVMSAESSLVVKWHKAFFEVADDQHPAAKIQQRLA